MNEALIIKDREDIAPQLDLAMEAFKDDILPALGVDDFFIDIYTTYRGDTIEIRWRWKRLKKKAIRSFTLSPNDTAEAFIDRVHSYLFQLIISIINLK